MLCQLSYYPETCGVLVQPPTLEAHLLRCPSDDLRPPPTVPSPLRGYSTLTLRGHEVERGLHQNFTFKVSGAACLLTPIPPSRFQGGCVSSGNRPRPASTTLGLGLACTHPNLGLCWTLLYPSRNPACHPGGSLGFSYHPYPLRDTQPQHPRLALASPTVQRRPVQHPTYKRGRLKSTKSVFFSQALCCWGFRSMTSVVSIVDTTETAFKRA